MKENEIDKLGTVLAIQNEITKDALNMLKEQQKRQVRMIWSSMAIVALAVAVIGVHIYCSFSVFNTLADQVRQNTELSLHNAEVINNVHNKESSQGLSD